MNRSSAYALSGAWLAGCLQFMASTHAGDPFPAQGDDDTTSLGSFRLKVAEAFQSLLTGHPLYNPATERLQSPTMFDPHTIIGRSSPHVDGSLADQTDGAAVGTVGTIIRDSDMSLRPNLWPDADDTREVHTEVRSFKMGDLPGPYVHAGADLGLPMSPGEVESKAGPGGAPADDFPAQSFFDIFVEVHLPGLGTSGALLRNEDPLLVVNEELTAFPPKVIYIHGNTSPVAVFFATDDPGGDWEEGDLFGWLVLAGHGIGFNDTPEDRALFGQFMANQAEIPEPEELAFLGGLGLLGFAAWRRTRQRRRRSGKAA